MHFDEVHLRNIPCSRRTIAIVYPNYWKDLEINSPSFKRIKSKRRSAALCCTHFFYNSMPRAFQNVLGHTDLLSPKTSIKLKINSSYKKRKAMRTKKIERQWTQNDQVVTLKPTPPPKWFRSHSLFIMFWSRSLSQLSRQFKPPPKSGHAPLSFKSRKNF